MTTRDPVVRADGLSRTFVSKSGHRVDALHNVDMTVTAGSFVHVEGPSGSGKTTLLALLGCMLRPSAGRLQVAGTTTTDLPARERTRFRLQNIGFVFQQFRLLGWLTVEENIMLPLQLAGADRRRERAIESLNAVGLERRRTFFPRELSGGEQQRVAVARALVTDPPLLLADEPTGSLDAEAGQQVLSLLRAAAGEQGRAVIVASHSEIVHSFADETLTLTDGKLL